MAKSFVGPFIVTFGIAIFALMMQVLWLYLDDIAGKGLGFFTVIELMGYKCVGLVPLAMPLALLISCVMLLGGMAEHYELSSFKSAGVSLLRIMRVLIVFGVLGAITSFVCADYVIPAANLQFGSRMYDIQQKKPTLNMEPGVFNEDFSQFAIRLGGRATNGRDINDVLIYDHTRAGTGDLGQIVANTGEMYTENDGRDFVMKLYDGEQYTERRATGKDRSALPFVRTSFETYTKVWDLSEFVMGSTAPELFKTNRSMLATWQLAIAIDSIDTDIKIRKQKISNRISTYLSLAAMDTVVYKEEFAPKIGYNPADSARVSSSIRQKVNNNDSGATANPTEKEFVKEKETVKTIPTRPSQTGSPSGIVRVDNIGKVKSLNNKPDDLKPKTVTIADRRAEARRRAMAHPLVVTSKDWPGINGMLDNLSKTSRTKVINRGRTASRSITSEAQSAQRLLPGIRESRVKHVYDLNMKYSMALVCIIFVFIGAPMGAIVRKGGFGYPILVSIIFFVVFIILTIFCRKLAESFVVNGTIAGWLPCIILAPVSIYITRAAMNDTKLVSIDGIQRWFQGLKKGFSRLWGLRSSKSAVGQ